jgi:hypothetical protein
MIWLDIVAKDYVFKLGCTIDLGTGGQLMYVVMGGCELKTKSMK